MGGEGGLFIFKQSDELFFKANLFLKMALNYVCLCIIEYLPAS